MGMWRELIELGSLEGERREDILLLSKLKELATGTEDNKLKAAISDILKELENILQTLKLEEIKIKEVPGKTEKILLFKKFFGRDFVALGEKHIAEKVLKVLTDENFARILDTTERKKVISIYKFLIKFRNHIAKRAGRRAIAIQKLIAGQIIWYFKNKPKSVNILTNLVQAYGKIFTFSLEYDRGGRLPEELPYTYYLRGDFKVSATTTDVAAYDLLGASLFRSNIGVTLGEAFKSYLRHKAKLGS